MKTLALEFSSAERSVALLDTNASGNAECRAQVTEVGMTTANTFKMIESALGRTNWRREEIEQIAVGLGPGSFTGIRAAIAIAQGWALARDVKLQGVHSAEALIQRARNEGMQGAAVIAIDAQRGEFYAARINPDSDVEKGTPALELVDAAQLQSWAEEGTTIMGPGIARKVEAARDLFPDARQVGLLALSREDWIEGEKLEPIYLRETSFVKAPPPRTIPAAGEKK